jgi:hypothetical protein
VSRALGEEHAAHVFDAKPEYGHDVIWDIGNGILLHPETELAMNEAHMAIVPDTSSTTAWTSNFRVVVVDNTLKDQLIEEINPVLGTFASLNLGKLTWPPHITTRPKKYLYFFFLITLFRRRRYNAADGDMMGTNFLT